MQDISQFLTAQGILPSLLSTADRATLAQLLRCAEAGDARPFLSLAEQAHRLLQKNKTEFLTALDALSHRIAEAALSPNAILAALPHDHISFREDIDKSALTHRHVTMLLSFRPLLDKNEPPLVIDDLSKMASRLSLYRLALADRQSSELWQRMTHAQESLEAVKKVFFDARDRTSGAQDALHRLLLALTQAASQAITDINKGVRAPTEYYKLLRIFLQQLHDLAGTVTDIKKEVSHVSISYGL